MWGPPAFCSHVTSTTAVLAFNEVENNAYCQAVIRARIQDKLAADAPIYSDVTSYTPTPDEQLADGVVGGFPCQAAQLQTVDGKSFTSKPFRWQRIAWSKDISQGGAQLGLQGKRSILCNHIFRLLDLTKGWLVQIIMELTMRFKSRRFALLENVGALLSTKLRPLLLHILQAWSSFNL